MTKSSRKKGILSIADVINKEVFLSRKSHGSLQGIPMENIPHFSPAWGLTLVREVRKLTYSRDGHLADHHGTQLARRFYLILSKACPSPAQPHCVYTAAERRVNHIKISRIYTARHKMELTSQPEIKSTPGYMEFLVYRPVHSLPHNHNIEVVAATGRVSTLLPPRVQWLTNVSLSG